MHRLFPFDWYENVLHECSSDRVWFLIGITGDIRDDLESENSDPSVVEFRKLFPGPDSSQEQTERIPPWDLEETNQKRTVLASRILPEFLVVLSLPCRGLF